VLQFGLGFSLAALYGYVPGGATTAWMIATFAVAWLIYVEVTHRLRHSATGKGLAAFDRGSRYLLMAALVAIALHLVGSDWSMPFWLRVKLGLFACVMACGVGIRLALISHFRTWTVMAKEGPNDHTNAVIRKTYLQATSVLVLLWVFIAALVTVSVCKPM